jgi:hypothetical protein
MGREFQLSANGDYDEIENRTILPMGIGLTCLMVGSRSVI